MDANASIDDSRRFCSPQIIRAAAVCSRAAVPASGRLRGREGALFSRHLFTGYMRCGECGGAFTTVSGGYGSPRYGCPAAWNSGASVCGNRLTIRAKVVDPALLAGLQAALLEPATIQRITDALARQLNRVLEQRPAVRESRVASREVLVRKIKNLVSAVEAGASSPALLQTLAAREEDLRGLEAELAQLAQTSPLRDRLVVMPLWVRQQVAQVADLLREVPERAKQEFRRLGVSFNPRATSLLSSARTGNRPVREQSGSLWTHPQTIAALAGAGRLADKRCILSVGELEIPCVTSSRDHRMECQETLEIRVGPEKCEADAEVADAPFDGRGGTEERARGMPPPPRTRRVSPGVRTANRT